MRIALLLFAAGEGLSRYGEILNAVRRLTGGGRHSSRTFATRLKLGGLNFGGLMAR